VLDLKEIKTSTPWPEKPCILIHECIISYCDEKSKSDVLDHVAVARVQGWQVPISLGQSFQIFNQLFAS
jgi:hypothetical protein